MRDLFFLATLISLVCWGVMFLVRVFESAPSRNVTKTSSRIRIARSHPVGR
jgi:hypothetical protein